MATITELQARIKKDLNRTDLDDEILEAIQDAVDFHSVESFWFQEDRATNTTEDAEPLYPLPEDYLSLQALYITINTAKYKLRQLSPLEFEALHFDETHKGEPTDFTIYDQQLKLGPTPDAEYTLTIYYSRYFSSPSSGSNDYTIGLLGQLIAARAKYILYADTIKDMNEAAVQSTREVRILGQLYKRNALYASNTRVDKYL